jgi:hypothetical protein
MNPSATHYNEHVAITGEVCSADIDAYHFVVRIEGGVKVSASFSHELENVILDAFRGHASLRLHVSGLGRFDSGSGLLEQIDPIASVEVVSTVPEMVENHVSPWDDILRIASEIPPELLASLPRDLSKRVDEYLDD